MKFRTQEPEPASMLQMTPMIDIVFQLLVFFIFTFKIVLPEGDFNIRMPAATQSTTSTPSETPLLEVKLRATPDRELARVQLGEAVLGGEQPFFELQSRIRGMIDDAAGPTANDQEVEIDADFGLKYKYVMRAITAITGYIDENGQRHPLVERVRFAPPRSQ
ncbi:MAG: biopolymer transporter ExbD [Planctomycetota bacterium]